MLTPDDRRRGDRSASVAGRVASMSAPGPGTGSATARAAAAASAVAASAAHAGMERAPGSSPSSSSALLNGRDNLRKQRRQHRQAAHEAQAADDGNSASAITLDGQRRTMRHAPAALQPTSNREKRAKWKAQQERKESGRRGTSVDFSQSCKSVQPAARPPLEQPSHSFRAAVCVCVLQTA